jgi:murein DD-endopeptidase MepM/ murein hydrolase activator NlpD
MKIRFRTPILATAVLALAVPMSQAAPAASHVEVSPSTITVGDAQPATTSIRFKLKHRRRVAVRVERAGKRVRTLASGSRKRGMHTLMWDGLDANGVPAEPGVYTVTLKVRNASVRRARVVVRTLPPTLSRWPVGGHVSSPFGWRGGAFHEGIDIPAKEGAAVLAPAAGVVTFAGTEGDYGMTVVIRHMPSAYDTRYSHLSEIAVAKGDEIVDGQTVGNVGKTGNATDFLLHFELRQPNGVAIDPLPHLPAD